MHEPFVKNLPVFAGLSCDQARSLGSRVIEKRLPPRTLLFSADDRAEYIYLIREGTVKLYRLSGDGRESIVSVLGPGDVFGEFLLGENLSHSVFAETMEAAFLCILPRRNFFTLLTEEPAIALAVIGNIGQRLTAHQDAIESLSIDDARARTIKLLLSLGSELGGSDDHWRWLDVPLTHQDMANMVALSRQTVTTVLNRLKDEGLIRSEGRRLWINEHALRQALDGG